jgi:hypothetical protein
MLKGKEVSGGGTHTLPNWRSSVNPLNRGFSGNLAGFSYDHMGDTVV